MAHPKYRRYFGQILVFAFIWLFFGVLFIYGIVNAIAGKDQTVPIVGDLFQKWFASLGK